MEIQISIDEEDTKVYVVKTGLNKKVQVEHTIETFDTSVIVFNPNQTKKRKLYVEAYENKKKVPAEFIKHILTLGFNEDDAREKLAAKRRKREEENKAKKLRAREIKQEKKAEVDHSAKNAIKNMWSNYKPKERPDPAVLFNQPSTSQG